MSGWRRCKDGYKNDINIDRNKEQKIKSTFVGYVKDKKKQD